MLEATPNNDNYLFDSLFFINSVLRMLVICEIHVLCSRNSCTMCFVFCILFFVCCFLVFVFGFWFLFNVKCLLYQLLVCLKSQKSDGSKATNK